MSDSTILDPVMMSPASQQLQTLARRVANSNCTVLLAGESGVGKEVLARFIHANSTRRGAPFVAVNCAAIPEQMLEATLFGWEKGAFTGAHAAHSGKFEQAQGGTLLLDEISEMTLTLQAKLLRVLQEREVERLGSEQAIELDVRVINTTNRDLRAEVAQGRFREDLYYRVNVFPLQLQPLRRRQEDILPLAMRLLARSGVAGCALPALSAAAAQCLLAYTWPGNVRELDNVMQRALVLCDGPAIEPDHLCFEQAAAIGTQPAVAAAAPRICAAAPAQAAAATPVHAAPEHRDRQLAGQLAHTEQQIIIEALRGSNGSRVRVAQRLGISPRTLRYKLARLRAAGVELQQFAGSAA
jgi:two-component system response regulator FlrC